MKSDIRNMARGASVVAMLTLLTACGGGDSGPATSGTSLTSLTPPPPPTCVTCFTIGGTVSGLQGSGLRLQIFAVGRPGHNIGPPLYITSNGPFTFDVDYSADMEHVTDGFIARQPSSPDQICRMHNAPFNRRPANVTNIEVGCSQYAYVANAGDNTVSAYAVDASSGALAAVGTPVKTGMSPHAIVGTPDRTYVFVANEGSNDISAFAVSVLSGALTPVPGSPFAAGTDPKALALYGSYLYVANAGSDSVSAFAVDGSGSLTPLSPATFATGKGPSSIAVDPATDGTGNHIYVANNGGTNDVSAFLVDFNTGLLTPIAGSPFPVGANPMSLVIVGNGSNLLYTANPDATNPSISGFHFDSYSGVLTPLSGSPFPLAVHDIATDPWWSLYLYVATGNGIVGYRHDSTTGLLAPLTGFPVVTSPGAHSMTFDTTNQFLYVTNDGSADVSGFRFDADTGELSPMTGSPFPAGKLPDSITVF